MTGNSSTISSWLKRNGEGQYIWSTSDVDIKDISNGKNLLAKHVTSFWIHAGSTPTAKKSREFFSSSASFNHQCFQLRAVVLCFWVYLCMLCFVYVWGVVLMRNPTRYERERTLGCEEFKIITVGLLMVVDRQSWIRDRPPSPRLVLLKWIFLCVNFTWVGGKTLIFVLGQFCTPTTLGCFPTQNWGKDNIPEAHVMLTEHQRHVQWEKPSCKARERFLTSCRVTSTDSSPCLRTAEKEPRVLQFECIIQSSMLSAESTRFVFLSFIWVCCVLFKFEMLCWCVTPRDMIYVLAISGEYVYTLGLRIYVL